MNLSGEIVAALIGAGAGALFAWLFGWSHHWQDRRRQRRLLATVMLSELRALDVTLRHAYEDPLGGIITPSAFRALRSTAEATALFDAPTVVALYDVLSYVDTLIELQGGLRTGSYPRGTLGGRMVQWQMEGAALRIPTLKDHLERLGGALIPFVPLDLGGTVREPPPLPPSPFGTDGGYG